MGYLQEVVFCFDQQYFSFTHNFFQLFGTIVQENTSKLFIQPTNTFYFPRIFLDLSSSLEGIHVCFTCDDFSKIIPVTNDTNIEKYSNETYRSISLDELRMRFISNNIHLTSIDHIGFNLPWFASGIHPKIEALRKELSQKCLYHKFPSGEPWDFILPGSIEEIDHVAMISYDVIRKPKLELVSFDKCSKPLIQFDLTCTGRKEQLKELFPEGIYDHYLGNIWVFVQNPFDVDFCLVLGEHYVGDWSHYFRDCRILNS